MFMLLFSIDIISYLAIRFCEFNKACITNSIAFLVPLIFIASLKIEQIANKSLES